MPNITCDFAKWTIFKGFAFGFPQPVMTGNFLIAEHARIKPALLQACLRKMPGLKAPGVAPPEDLPQFLDWFLLWSFSIEESLKIRALARGRVLSLVKDGNGNFVCDVVVPYHDPHASQAIMKWLLHLVNAALSASPGAMRDVLAGAIADLQILRDELHVFRTRGVNTHRILQAAIDSQISFFRLEGDTYILGEGCKSVWLRSTCTDATGYLATLYSCEKQLGSKVLALHGLPVAEHYLARDEDEAVKLAQKIGYPVVVKPADKDGGIGVHAGLTTEGLVRACYRDALRHSRQILVEKHFEGRDYRLTILQGRMIKAIERIPGGVTGDAQHTVRELLNLAAMDATAQRRGGERGKNLLILDDEAIALLAETRATPESIPAAGSFVRLRRRSNVSSGGTTRLVMNTVHPDNQRLAERAAEVMRLDVAGIDLLIPDIARSWHETGAIICEVNSQPQIGETDTPGLLRTFLGTLVQGTGRIPVGLILRSNDSGSHAESLEKFWLPFSRNQPGTALAAAGVLRLDKELLSTSNRGYIAAGQAAINCRDANRLLLAASWREVLTEGIPVSRIDMLIIEPSSDNNPAHSQLAKLAQLLAPHVKGYVIYAAEDHKAVEFANCFSIAQRCMVCVNNDSPNLRQHLVDGGFAVRVNELNSAEVVITARNSANGELCPLTVTTAPCDDKPAPLLMLQAVRYLAEQIDVRNRCCE